MIGLEFACKVFKKENKELAEKLKISSPNISAWMKGTREIPPKYLSQLSKIFSNLPPELFQKEMTNVDELKIRIHFIESLSWDERHGELTVYDPNENKIIDEYIDDHEEELRHLRTELANTLKVVSYNDQLKCLFEQLNNIGYELRVTQFGNKNPEDFILGKLNNYLSFLSKFESEKIELTDTIINYLISYQGVKQSEWVAQSLFPNEKLLSFYSDLEEVLMKHQLIKRGDEYYGIS